MPEHIPFIRIFISSPGDVNDERQIALKVIEQLPYRPAFREKVAFHVIAWDKPGAGTPMRATMTPQDAINRGLPTPAECDIVIVLFWSRIGTPFTHTDDKEYRSGTHWELLNALESERAETVIYRRTDEPPFKVSDSDFDEKHAQYKAVQAFFKSDLFYGPDGKKIRRGINMYKTPDDFRRAFEIDLEVLVLEILNRSAVVPTRDPELNDGENITSLQPVKWPPDKSPFPGLHAFTEDDAPIFFGRGYETDALIRQFTNSRFVAVVGASGSGKSSLVGAGLIPRLRGNAISGSKDWRIARFTPGASPFESLYDAVLEAFPQFKPNPLEARRIKQNFIADMHESPETLTSICMTGLEGAPPWAEVLLFVDQFEELFTLSNKADAQSFVEMLESITHSVHIRVVVTMRHDFFNKAVENQTLAELLRADAVFSLAIPKRDALRQMIERPAERAGLTFDHALVDRILDNTGDEPGNLALMAYTLDELYKLDDDKTLTHDEYEQLGGVQGAIGTRAENQFMALGIDESVIQQGFHALVEVDERGTATRRREQFQPDSRPDDMRRLIKAFADARLLTTNYDTTSKTATVEVAHEAIFSSWPRLAKWIEATQDDLRLLRQIRNSAQEWAEKARPDFLLWPQERLMLVYAMQQRLNPELNEIEQDFIEPEQARLLRELEALPRDDTSHERRRDIGDRLAKIGDTRPGVGVRDGLPDILWLPIEVLPESVTFKTRKIDIGPIRIEPFFIAKYLVTYGQYQAFVAAPDGFDNPEWWKDFPEKYRPQQLDDQRTKTLNSPRDMVSWYQSVAFVRWMNHRLNGLELLHPSGTRLQIGGNAEIRLPMEWEWQWAAQGGIEKRAYPWGDWQIGYANTLEAGLSRTTAVGMFPHGAADCGALDLVGNIWGWCQNDHADHRIINGFGNAEPKVLRGGSFNYDRKLAAAEYRDFNFPVNVTYFIGLRLVCGISIMSLISSTLNSES